MKSTFALLLISAFLIPAVIGMAQDPVKSKNTPEIWMTHMRPQELAYDNARCEYVIEHLDGIEIYINVIAFIAPIEELKSLAGLMKKNRIKLAVECGYFDWANDSADFSAPNPKGISDKVRQSFDRNVGEETAHLEMAKMKALLDAGIIPDYLNLDGSVRRMLYPGEDVGKVHQNGFQSIDVCVEELFDYIKTWHEKYPTIRFFALTNFPNWGWKGEPAYWGDREGKMHWGDYYEVVRRILAKAKDTGLPLAGVTCDNPYEYTMGTHPVSSLEDPKKINWMSRILDLEGFVKSQGFEFNLIVNSEGGGIATSEAFATETLKYLDACHLNKCAPHRMFVQSWYKCPEKVTPENEPFTMANLVKSFIEKVNAR